MSEGNKRQESGPGAVDAATEGLRGSMIVEAAHEIGHTAGLVHCPVTDCAMHRTLWPEGIDLKRPAYCPACCLSLAAGD